MRCLYEVAVVANKQLDETRGSESLDVVCKQQSFGERVRFQEILETEFVERKRV